MAGQDDGHYCLAFDSDSNHYFWDNCGDKNMGSCQSSYGALLDPSQEKGTWKEYVDICSRQASFPHTGIQGPIEYFDGERGLWVGRIRSWIIVNSTDATPADMNYGYVGYVTYEHESYHLRFNKLSGNSRWKLICIRGSIHKSSTVEKTTGSTMIAVFVVSPCGLIAIVVIVTLSFIKRRRRRNDDAYVDTGIRFKKTKPTPGVANAAYDGNAIHAGPEKVQDHSNWVLEKEPDNAALCSDDDANDYDKTTTGKTQVHNDNDGNVYNTLEASSDDTYDHTAVDIIDKIKHNNDNDGNVYNTIEASSVDTYDHTRYEINKIKNIDDTYNHAGNECDTENEYSTANKRNDTRDSEHTFDDTYTHI